MAWTGAEYLAWLESTVLAPLRPSSSNDLPTLRRFLEVHGHFTKSPTTLVKIPPVDTPFEVRAKVRDDVIAAVERVAAEWTRTGANLSAEAPIYRALVRAGWIASEPLASSDDPKLRGALERLIEQLGRSSAARRAWVNDDIHSQLYYVYCDRLGREPVFEVAWARKRPATKTLDEDLTWIRDHLDFPLPASLGTLYRELDGLRVYATEDEEGETRFRAKPNLLFVPRRKLEVTPHTMIVGRSLFFDYVWDLREGGIRRKFGERIHSLSDAVHGNDDLGWRLSSYRPLFRDLGQYCVPVADDLVDYVERLAERYGKPL
ncbi:MAG: hypothetical protein AAGE52_16500 [Myxococcota bacterium]